MTSNDEKVKMKRWKQEEKMKMKRNWISTHVKFKVTATFGIA